MTENRILDQTKEMDVSEENSFLVSRSYPVTVAPKSTSSEDMDYFEWIYPRLPTASQYVELSTSSLVLLPWRQAADVETLNDQTGDLRAFYKVLREDESELIELLYNDKNVQKLLNKDILVEADGSSEEDGLKRAASFFIRAGGLSPPTDPDSTPGGWAFHVSDSGTDTKISESKYRIQYKLHDLANRLRRVQIENKEVAEVLDRYDDEETLFYGDWSLSGRAITDEELRALKNSQANVAIVSAKTEGSLENGAWTKTQIPVNSVPSAQAPLNGPNQRILYTSYDPVKADEGSLANGEYPPIQSKISDLSGNGEISPGKGSSPRRGKLLPFRWYGGKYSHFKWLNKALPEAQKISGYIEPFGGSGAVLLNREPCEKEIYNDIDTDVTNFFEVLKTDRDELLRKIALTPFSREELAHAAANKNREFLSDLERARLFFVRAGQTRSGLAQEASAGRWAYCKKTSRRNMSGAVSRWHGRLEQLYYVADRLEGVVIRNENAVKLIREYSSDEATLLYCDPPYPHETRGDTNAYGFEMTDDDHRELAKALRDCAGKVAVSSYESDLYDKLYSGWYKIKSPEKTVHSNKETARECLWTNYDPGTLNIDGVDVHSPNDEIAD